ncbi:MAG TPA: tyrosine-type recombinase/integrase, partial [Candidatus Methanomethylicus sp.]|nr:tyrosine-type recombinase/integrase [Candidatus Methanomethylicus sp.]
MTRLSLGNVPAWAEVEEFLEKMRTLYRKKEAPLRDLVIMSILPTTGMKVSELLALRKEDFLLSDEVVLIRNRNGTRRAAIMPKITTYVKEYIRGLRDGEPAFDLTRRQVL